MEPAVQIDEVQPKKPSDFLPNEQLQALATVWFKNTDAFKTIQNQVLQDFCERYEFTKDEYDAYKRGAASVLDILYACYAEREAMKFKSYQEEEGKKK